jgi:[ribosomal protein S5]-alanine N-acetyltransferase
MKSYAKDMIGLKTLAAIVDPANLASIRVLEKIGMTFKKMVRLSEDDIELKLFTCQLQ